MPTMDDDFWTFFLVGITSLNSILVASSFKCLLSRPVVQEVSKIRFRDAARFSYLGGQAVMWWA